LAASARDQDIHGHLAHDLDLVVAADSLSFDFDSRGATAGHHWAAPGDFFPPFAALVPITGFIASIALPLLKI